MKLRVAFRYFAKAPQNECNLCLNIGFPTGGFLSDFVAYMKILSVSETILHLRIG